MSDLSCQPPQPHDLPLSISDRKNPSFAVFVFPDYDLSKLKDFMDQQVDSYIEKGIIAKDEGDTIKRIYSSL